MPKYTYKVRDEQGKTFTGSYTTDSKDRLRAALQNKGYLVLDITEATGGLFSGKVSNDRRKGGKVPGHGTGLYHKREWKNHCASLGRFTD